MDGYLWPQNCFGWVWDWRHYLFIYLEVYDFAFRLQTDNDSHLADSSVRFIEDVYNLFDVLDDSLMGPGIDGNDDEVIGKWRRDNARVCWYCIFPFHLFVQVFK